MWPNHGRLGLHRSVLESSEKDFPSLILEALFPLLLLYADRKTSIRAGATLPLCRQEEKEQRVTEKSARLFSSRQKAVPATTHICTVFSEKTEAPVAIQTQTRLLLTVTPLPSIPTNHHAVVLSPWECHLTSVKSNSTVIFKVDITISPSQRCCGSYMK